MDWRRGVLIAVVNLAAVAPMIALVEARDTRYVEANEQHNAANIPDWKSRERDIDRSGSATLLRVQEEQTITFDPCIAWVHYPAQVEVVRFGNMPAAAVVGWRLACRPRWTLSGWLLGAADRAPNRHLLPVQRRVDIALCALVVVQWILIGAFPLGKSRKVWSEPGAFITACTMVGAILAMIHGVEGLARFPALFAGLAWLWWIVLLFWKGVQLSWHSLIRLRKSAVTV
jgi:hypothetical protein